MLTCPRPADSPVAALAELADMRYLEELPKRRSLATRGPQTAGRCQARRHPLVTDTPNTSSAACNASRCGPGSGSGSVPAAALVAAAAGVPAALAAARAAAPAVRAGPAPASRVPAALLDQHRGRGLAPSCRALRRRAPRAHGNDLRAPGDDSQPGPPPTTRRQTCIDVLCAYLCMPCEPTQAIDRRRQNGTLARP